jgi:succinoglycan biosynthesis transport protein ExoP
MKVLARYYPQYASPRSTAQPAVSDDDYYYSDQDQNQNKHLRDYWQILLKRLRYMVPVFCAVVAIGLLFGLFSPTLYTAKSTLKIEPQTPSFTGILDTSSAQDLNKYDYYQTQFALLNGAPLAARVIKGSGLESNPALTTGRFSLFSWIMNSVNYAIDSITGLFQTPLTGQRPAAYELGVAPGLISRYRSFLKVEPVKNTRLVDVSFSTPDPRLSQQLANAHATAFIQMILENHFNLTQEARDFLGKKLAELRGKVVTAENELNKFRQAHGVVSLEKGENIVVDRLVDLNKQLTQTRSERIQAESLYQMTRNKNSEYLAQVLSNPLILQIKGTLANLETEKGRLSSTYTAEHPRMQELNQQIAEAKRGLASEVANIVRGIESNYAAARGREQALEAEAKKQQDTALDLKEVGVDYAVLNEEVVVNRGLYENVLKRMNETNVANDLAASNMQVVQRAEVPTVPSSPNMTRIFLVSAFLGLFLAVAMAFFLEYMDSTMNTPQQVWAAVSLATLGVVPHLKSLRQRYHPMLADNSPTNRLESAAPSEERVGKEIVVARDQFSMIAESYRTIRTALMLSQAERPPKVILLTSPCPNEGKTVTTLNLGIALAQSGKKVLAIDADLRKGRCHQLLHLRNHGGLADVLAGHLDVKRGIQKTAINDFYLLPRGTLPPNPADLLMSQRMRDVLNELRSSFDFIVFDSPPIIAVSDAAVLSAVCDGVVLVFNGQKTTSPSARRALERLDKVGARMLGVILNGIDIRDPEYFDYRSYYPSNYASVEDDSDPTQDFERA